MISHLDVLGLQSIIKSTKAIDTAIYQKNIYQPITYRGKRAQTSPGSSKDSCIKHCMEVPARFF